MSASHLTATGLAFVVTAIDVWTSGIDENDPAVSISPRARVKLARRRARGYDKALLGIV
jgi:hypothetical protein